MSKKMTSAKCFDAIDVALENLEGVTDAVRNIQNKEIPEIFWWAQELESLEHQITILKVGMTASGEGTNDALQVNDQLVAIETN